MRYGAAAPFEPPAQWTDVLAQQLAHRSVRSYRPDPVPDETLHALIAAAQSAPTSGNLQLWSVVAVRDDRRRRRLAELAGEQEFIAQAPLFLVWLADLARAREVTAGAGSETAEGADFVEAAVLSFVDVALAAQNASLAAESLGLGTVFVGAIRNRPLDVAAELGLPPNVFPVFGLAVGYPDRIDGTAVKPRLPQDAVLHHEQYSLEPQLAHLAAYEDVLNEFYAAAGLPQSWSRRVAHRFGTVAGLKGREHLRAALLDRGFQLR
ncbi:NADPH-dependent oxidoreductase [Kribbella sandramycini]|uniref:NADPH-dependent oxidoreductase n=1 Tax=Kribbella sandramycini TaxID=60450 RepID=A0A7Y4KXB4_9ACTN|nr:NADPH-dependent oxidoreductase [Kribbella sandramycini]NOL40344.1 NADPH-dependent oxidoreductase [Kribbella sandramycini]